MNQDVLRRLGRGFRQSLCDSEPGAALSMAYKGEVVFSEAVGLADVEKNRSLTSDSQLDAGSIAKMLTGIAIAMLEDEGGISSDTSLCDILPEFPAYGDSVKLGHLLHHESGIRDYAVLLYYMTGWHEQAPPSSDHVFRTLCRAGSLIFPPGNRYMYSNSNYFLLARIVEQVTGTRFGQFIEDRILLPLGMTSSAMVDLTSKDISNWAQGYVDYPSKLASPYAYRKGRVPGTFSPVHLSYRHVGGGGFRTTTTDLLKLGLALAGTTKGLSESVRERVLATPRVQGDGFGYGHGVFAGPLKGLRTFGHSGEIEGFTATLACFPDQDLILACLANRQDDCARGRRNAALDVLLGEQGRQERDDASSAIPRTRATHGDSEVAKQLVGFYLNPKSAQFVEVRYTDDMLSISIDGGEAVPMLGEGPWKTNSGVDVMQGAPSSTGARTGLIIKQHHVASRYLPFRPADGVSDWTEFEGSYACATLETTFCVEGTANGVRLTCEDAGRPSMDLDYLPTIPDFFWSQDPHPGISQIQFLRDESGVYAFIYRDYDGDRREDFAFVRIGPP